MSRLRLEQLRPSDEIKQLTNYVYMLLVNGIGPAKKYISPGSLEMARQMRHYSPSPPIRISIFTT